MVATIVVVGNGPSVGRCGLGAQIDQFDEVVRFNRFVTDGFAPHCGTKTTIWVRNNITPPTARTGEFQRWVSCPPRHRYRHAPLPHEFEIPQDVVTDVLQSLAGPWPRTKCPSAGLITLAYLTTRYPQISVVGFDGFDPRFARRALHYYRDGYRCINASCHSSPYEQGCLQRWVRAGIVVLLHKENTDGTGDRHDRVSTTGHSADASRRKLAIRRIPRRPPHLR